jgi:hypothetical protein
MSDSLAADVMVEAIQKLMEHAPDGLALVLLVGDIEKDKLTIIKRGSDEHTRDLIACAFEFIADQDPPPPEGTLQ